MRPIDKEGALDRISHCVDPERGSAPDERTVVVATQAIEVGADFSFDALISEAAPIDSLCQRLGRLDRRGSLAARRDSPARCWVLGVASEMKPNRRDPVYGDAVRHAWEELQSHATGGEIDAGPGADLMERLGSAAQAPRLEAPLLLPTHLDAWAQTNPEPVADPPIAEFLHGKDSQREPDVSVAWRWDWSDDALKVVPLRPAEFLAVPLSAFRGWLRRTAEAPVSDTDTAPPEVERPHAARGGDPVQRRLLSVRRWTGQEDGLTEALGRVEDIQPGDLLIADPAMGGLTAGTWDPSARPSARLGASDEDVLPEPVEDLGDHAQLAHGRRATLRLDPRLLEGLALSRAPSPRDEQDTLIARREAISQWLAELLDPRADALPPWIVRVAERLRASDRFDIELVGAGAEDGYYVLVEPAVDPAILDEFDDRPSLTGRGTELRDHLGGVGAKAEEYGGRLGLSAGGCQGSAPSGGAS